MTGWSTGGLNELPMFNTIFSFFHIWKPHWRSARRGSTRPVRAETKMKKQELPACNGRPQLWTRQDLQGLRIVYPSGRVDWYMLSFEQWDSQGCTSRRTQWAAIKACFEYDAEAGCKAPEFLGYL